MSEHIFTDQNFESEVLASKEPVLVDLWAPWCVSTDTTILDANNLFVSAKDIQRGNQLRSYARRSLRPEEVRYSASSSRRGHCKKIMTTTGRSIDVTDEHGFFTSHGWKEARDLRVGDRVAVYPVDGWHSHVSSDDAIVVDARAIRRRAHASMRIEQYLGELKEKGLLPLRTNNTKLLIIARLMGALFSDGTLYAAQRTNYRELSFNVGQKEDVQALEKDFEILGFRIKKDERTNEQRIGSRSFTSHTYRVRCSATALWLLMKALGVPEGNKTNSGYRIPRWILRAPKAIQREFLAAYLGGDGPKLSMTLRERAKKESYNNLSINDLEFHKRSDLAAAGVRFAQDIALLLKKFGVTVRRIFTEQEKAYRRSDGDQPIIVHIRFAHNFSTGLALADIGYRYSQQKQQTALYVGEFLRRSLQRREQWKTLWKQAHMLARKKFSCPTIAARLGIAVQTVQSWILRGVKPTSPYHFEKFPSWLKKMTKGLGAGLLWDTIQEVKEVYLEKVQYITLGRVHNFIANGFLTHNCGPCRMLSPLVEELAKEYEGKGIKIGKLNVDENPDIATKYHVMSIPTLLFMKNGEVVDQMIGMQTREQLKEKIEEIIG